MTTFAEGRERNLALGIWGAASGSGGAAGVLLGGALTSALQLVVDLLHQRPGRDRRDRARRPVLLRESRADLGHRHFDLAGRRVDHRRADAARLRDDAGRAARLGRRARRSPCSRVAGALIAGFVAIELRSQAPLLPLRIFRLRTLSASNATACSIGGAIFSQFFLLTLYMQQVLHYSAIKTGVAYIGLTLTIVVFSDVAQALVTRVGVRRVLPVGLRSSAVALVLFAQLPVHGHYFWRPVPGLPAQRHRARALVRADDDRRA